MTGELVFERADTVAWLDLPVRLVMSRLLLRTHGRKKHEIELWQGNREGSWCESLRYLVWPAFKRAFENRRRFPAVFARYPQLRVYRLCSDADVRWFLHAFERQSEVPSVF
jgi:hypothetical protein